MSCAICETRKPRRYCPGARGDICAPCCGTEREVTIPCPFDCEYLQEARRHERAPTLNEEDLPNRDIDVTDGFLEANESLVSLIGMLLLEAAADAPGAIDADVREALGFLIRTYRTLESGLYYESRPNNPIAAAVQQSFQARLSQVRQEQARQSGMNTIRDAAVLGVLAFHERTALLYDNGRSRGRTFLHFLHDQFSDRLMPEVRAPRPVIIP